MFCEGARPLGLGARRPVQEDMQSVDNEMCIASQTSLAEALQKMMQTDSRRLLVMQNSEISGMLTNTGILRFLEGDETLQGASR